MTKYLVKKGFDKHNIKTFTVYKTIENVTVYMGTLDDDTTIFYIALEWDDETQLYKVRAISINGE
jgi:hypothetical protein